MDQDLIEILKELTAQVVEINISYSGETERWTVKSGTGHEAESDDMEDAILAMNEIVLEETRKSIRKRKKQLRDELGLN